MATTLLPKDTLFVQLLEGQIREELRTQLEAAMKPIIDAAVTKASEDIKVMATTVYDLAMDRYRIEIQTTITHKAKP